MKKSPVREYKQIKFNTADPGYLNRLMIGTPSTGTVRMEWAAARYGQIIPINWSAVNINNFLNPYIPMRYSVADAQNLIVKTFLENDFEWLLLIEQDNVLPPDTFLKFNRYIREAKVPVVSGLYYTKSQPSEPLVFRGRGTSCYDQFKLGDKVWCDGVPTGALLIHGAILRKMWDESPEYLAGDTKVHRVFRTPRDLFFDPETKSANMVQGTSDLDWCSRVMDEGFFKKAGWDKYQKMQYPFLVDTDIFIRHIDENGKMYPY